MPNRRPAFRVLAVVAMLLLALAALPAVTAAQPDDDPGAACEQGGWQTLAPAEDPTHAFASQGDCVSYASDGGDLVELQAGPAAEPVGTDAPDDGEIAPGRDDDAEPAGDGPTSDTADACREGAWADLAPMETPTLSFESQDDCASYVAQGGAAVPVQAVEEPDEADAGPGDSDAIAECQQGGWDDLAPVEAPLDAFDSQGDCVRYAADGGDAVDAITFNVQAARDDCAAAERGHCLA